MKIYNFLSEQAKISVKIALNLFYSLKVEKENFEQSSSIQNSYHQQQLEFYKDFSNSLFVSNENKKRLEYKTTEV